MDKNAIKKYAVWARNELIARVTQKAEQYEITEKKTTSKDADSINGRLLTDAEKNQRKALIEKIQADGFEQVMEEVAYTWFNRFTALRFMEVNNYLPSHTRVFTNEAGEFKPQILADAIQLDLEGLDMDKVFELKDANKTEELYKYLLITQCNALSVVLPRMFQKIEHYTELLLPDYLLREGSVIEQMITLIPEKDWTDQVQIIGWLYQYYNSEPKDAVFAALKKNVKISKENIPAATQLFTPDWIVRYMVENSLGRLWLEGHPDEKLQAEWKYYLSEPKQEQETERQLVSIHKEYASLNPSDILCIDPCQGSGHILAYMFDVFVQIYEAYGYSAREAAVSIVEHNIWGIDIDERATQLAYFSIMMKARQYDRRFFNRGVQPHIFAIQESNNLDPQCIEYFANGRNDLKTAMVTLVKELSDAKEYGSILSVTKVNFTALFERFEEIRNEDIPNIYSYRTLETLLPFVEVAQAMAQKYHVVVTNPPYMGGTGMSPKLDAYIKSNYDRAKTDLYSVFIEKCHDMTVVNGYQAMITQHGWMFLSSFEKMRLYMLQFSISSMAHLGARAFDEIGGEVVQSVAFVMRNSLKLSSYKGNYVQLTDYTGEAEKERHYFQEENRFINGQSAYSRIPGSPIAYWCTQNVIKSFEEAPPLSKIAEPRQGVKTLNNDLFLKLWFEVNYDNISFDSKSIEDSVASGKKWFPYNKGGTYRKWYGNNDYLVNWYNDGFDMKKLAVEKYHSVTRTITNISYFFKPGLTWSSLSSGNISLRAFGVGYIFDSKGSSMFFVDERQKYYVLALINSKVSMKFLEFLAPTLDFNIGPLSKIPVKLEPKYYKEVDALVQDNIDIAKEDWDSFETSWDFQVHPLVSAVSKYSDRFADPQNIDIATCYECWANECEKRFNELKTNEVQLNKIFIDVYGLEDEMTPDITDEEVTVRKAELQRDIKGLISFAVGCMFGRYSLATKGIVYSGGAWPSDKYGSYLPDADGIIPICDDEYFEDDIVGKFVEFIRVVYGERTLEANLSFIASALGGKGSARDVLRNYFINDFYSDHCNTYSVSGSGKRPIYWLFDSGKKNGFKCLIYMHRYHPDTIARIRTDYVHEQQSRYRTAIADLEQRISIANTSDRVKLNKQLSVLQAQAEEIRTYEEKIHHLADQMISIDLDDGVKQNYEIFKDVLAKIK